MLDHAATGLPQVLACGDAAVDAQAAGPQPFTLLGEDIVLFLDAQGQPAALQRPLLPPHGAA